MGKNPSRVDDRACIKVGHRRGSVAFPFFAMSCHGAKQCKHWHRHCTRLGLAGLSRLCGFGDLNLNEIEYHAAKEQGNCYRYEG